MNKENTDVTMCLRTQIHSLCRTRRHATTLMFVRAASALRLPSKFHQPAEEDAKPRRTALREELRRVLHTASVTGSREKHFDSQQEFSGGLCVWGSRSGLFPLPLSLLPCSTSKLLRSVKPFEARVNAPAVVRGRPCRRRRRRLLVP
ncbi:hypothetical protein FQA47_019028 [Oryzias melastigma]|uniref:Uncharacterized protein n=1 Tax=Oryzias melastigma TaxID=30732 RepID=A0A834FK09_ORYME|nr:hypothetical protein FQA47_019028 [Oryzias melastigma]